MFREAGSFNHGTGVRGLCDVDLLVSLNEAQPTNSDTALRWVRDALAASFPHTTVRVSRPAVVVEFNGGAESWEVIPGFRKNASNAKIPLYDVPGAAAGWLESAPSAHLTYVTQINGEASIAGGAKKLARLVKAWKYYNNVPISSFYLEMRAAKYLSGESLFLPAVDICNVLEHLNSIQLAAMNDPAGVTSRFYACSSDAKARDALSKLATGATRARKAATARANGDPATAYYYLDLLFGGKFPAR